VFSAEGFDIIDSIETYARRAIWLYREKAKGVADFED
jgi:hypothetical protein